MIKTNMISDECNTRCWSVYLHTNNANNKMYCGITSKTPEERWKNGGGYYGQVFYNAIKKYGWDGFAHEVIASNLTKEEAENFEVTLIRELNLNNNTCGYNISNGGNSKGKHSVETIEKIRISKVGKTSSDDKKEKIRKSMTGKMAGGDNPNAKQVICITTNEVFDSMADAARKYNTYGSKITKACNEGKYAGRLNDGTKLEWRYYHKKES